MFRHSDGGCAVETAVVCKAPAILDGMARNFISRHLKLSVTTDVREIAVPFV